MTSGETRESHVLQVVCGPDGRIMLEPLDKSVTEAAMRDWMRARFAQDDPLVRLDQDQLESPHELFVDLWTRSEANTTLRKSMNRATAELLPIAWEAGAADWVEWLLRFVETVTPPAGQQFLSRLVQDPQFERTLQDRHLDLGWLAAAASYPSQGPLVDAWKALLTEERYAQLAYFALRGDLEFGVRDLPAYFRALPESERPLLVREAVRWLFEQDGRRARALLEACWKDYGKVPGLSETVEQALSDLGRLPIREARPTVFQRNSAEKSRSPLWTFPETVNPLGHGA